MVGAMSTPAATETSRIADQLRRAYEGPAWHGDSLRELLAPVTPEQAAHRPIPGAHTIQELVLHIAAWMRIARERLTAIEVREVTAEENWTPAVPSWDKTLAVLEAEQHALEQAILEFPAQRLDEQAPAAELQTFYVLLHGVVQHNLYHAGQIALLRKATP
jgi:uncharacterized damage-inducible protein DinB